MTELEYLKGKLADTESAIEREERKRDLNLLAEFAKDLYDSFIGVGFDDEKAWWFTGTIFQSKVK